MLHLLRGWVPPTMDEEQIIKGCKAQKCDAQKALYEMYARIMYGICLRYCTDGDTAKDLLQDGFMKIYTNIHSFEGRGSFEGWMKRVFVNLALENIRKTKKINFGSEDIENLADELVDDSTLDDNNMNNISISELLKMVKSLAEGYSTVFNLYAIEGYSHKEIAKMLDISEGTSRSQYVRARQALQVMVKEYIRKNI